MYILCLLVFFVLDKIDQLMLIYLNEKVSNKSFFTIYRCEYSVISEKYLAELRPIDQRRKKPI